MLITDCYLLSSIKYGDTDVVINVFSKEEGYLSFFGKNFYSSRSKKKSYLFPLNEVKITSLPLKEKKIATLSKIEILQTNYNEKNISTSCILLFTSEFLHTVLKNESKNSKIYSLISDFLSEVQTGNMDAYCSLIFKLLEYNGFSPLLSSLPFLNPLTGKFTHEIFNQDFSAQVSEIWKKFLLSENTFSIRLTTEQRRAFLHSLLLYYQIHFDQFKIPSSYQVMKEVFG